MTEPRYGRFDEQEFKRRGNDRHLFMDGQHYRIAELVPQMDGSARYQAWPVEDAGRFDEPERPGPFEDGGTFGPPYRTGDENDVPTFVPPTEEKEDARAREGEGDPLVGLGTLLVGDVVSEVPAPPQGPPPKLADFARQNGWTGHGPVSRAIREKYTAEFGVEGGRP